MTDPHQQPAADDDAEVLDGLAVLEEDEGPGVDTSGLPAPLRAAADVVLATPARQVATLAAGGFMAGAATVALVHRQSSRTAAKRLRARRGRPALGEIVASNSFLVDVHLLRRD